MNKETFYFSHDYNTRSDVKIKKLISKHGYLGYGIYWAIVEDLYQNANALPMDCDCIAYDMRCDVEVINSIINDFELFVIEDNVFGSLSVQRRLDERNERSKKARKSAMKRWGNNANAMRTHSDSNANALQTECEPNAIKERKVKERKVKDIVDTTVSMSIASQSTENVNYDEVINFFNSKTKGVFGEVRLPINENRKKAIRARIREHGKVAFGEVIAKATQSDFLKGNTNFKATFDWIIKPGNFQKILEGNYDNRIKNEKEYGNEKQQQREGFVTDVQNGLLQELLNG